MEEITNESRSRTELVDPEIRELPDLSQKDLEVAYKNIRRHLSNHYSYFMYDKKKRAIVAVYNDPIYIIFHMRRNPGLFQLGHVKEDPYGIR